MHPELPRPKRRIARPHADETGWASPERSTRPRLQGRLSLGSRAARAGTVADV